MSTYRFLTCCVALRLTWRLALLIVTVGVSPLAWGHKLNLFTYVEGNTVHVEGYFADGSKAKLRDVTAFNSAQQIVAEGKTNENGEYNFQVPAPADVQIVLNAGFGHQAQYMLTAGEFGSDAMAVTAPPAAVPNEMGNDATASVATTTTSVIPHSADLSEAQLQALIQRAVVDGIKPLAREIDALKNKTTLQDVVGGLGYILGAFGIWAYLQSRRLKRSAE